MQRCRWLPTGGGEGHRNAADRVAAAVSDRRYEGGAEGSAYRGALGEPPEMAMVVAVPAVLVRLKPAVLVPVALAVTL